MSESGKYRPRLISIHALREEGDTEHYGHKTGHRRISIHALREEGDRDRRKAAQHRYISIHALREEGDYDSTTYMMSVVKFLSTPSARRATTSRQKRA